MFRFLISILLLLLASSTSALKILCGPTSNDNFTKHLATEFYTLEHVLEDDETYTFSLTVKGEFHGLPLQDVMMIRTKSEKNILGAILKMHPVDDGFITHVVSIPKNEISQYKFHVFFSDREKLCSDSKGYYVSFST